MKKIMLIILILIFNQLNLYSFSLLGSAFKADLSKKVTEIKDNQNKNNKVLSDIQAGVNNNKTGFNDLQTELKNINFKFDKFADIESKIVAGVSKDVSNQIKNTVGGNQVNNDTDIFKILTMCLSVILIISILGYIFLFSFLLRALSKKDLYKKELQTLKTINKN